MEPSYAGYESPRHHPCCPGMTTFGAPAEPDPTEWTTKDKRVLAFGDMGDRHLLLTLRLLIRRASYARAGACIDTLWLTRNFEHDDAESAIGELFENTWEDHVCAHYKPILKEARKRKLKNARKNFLDAYGERIDGYTQRLELMEVSALVNARVKKDGGKPFKVMPRPERWFNA